MRIVFFLLLLANLTLWGYTRLDSMANGEGVRLMQQIRPEQIRLLTPQQVAALKSPDKVKAGGEACVEWGPFADPDRARAIADLDALVPGLAIATRRVEVTMTHWVYLPPLSNKNAAEKRATELRNAGLKDVLVVDGGPKRFAISLGIFRGEEAASARLDELKAQKVNNAKMEARDQVIQQSVVSIKGLPAAAAAKLKDAEANYPGTALRVGACDATS